MQKNINLVMYSDTHHPTKRYQQLSPEEGMTIGSLLFKQYTISLIAQLSTLNQHHLARAQAQ